MPFGSVLTIALSLNGVLTRGIHLTLGVACPQTLRSLASKNVPIRFGSEHEGVGVLPSRSLASHCNSVRLQPWTRSSSAMIHRVFSTRIPHLSSPEYSVLYFRVMVEK
jgi:hypothetical protein